MVGAGERVRPCPFSTCFMDRAKNLSGEAGVRMGALQTPDPPTHFYRADMCMLTAVVGRTHPYVECLYTDFLETGFPKEERMWPPTQVDEGVCGRGHPSSTPRPRQGAAPGGSPGMPRSGVCRVHVAAQGGWLENTSNTRKPQVRGDRAKGQTSASPSRGCVVLWGGVRGVRVRVFHSLIESGGTGGRGAALQTGTNGDSLQTEHRVQRVK